LDSSDENYIERLGPVKPDILDYLISFNLKNFETFGLAFKKSELFQKVDIIHASRSNGEGENLVSDDDYELRFVVLMKDGLKVYGYHLFGPGRSRSEFIEGRDLKDSMLNGWDLVAEKAESLL
jgi:hypothetical protein